MRLLLSEPITMMPHERHNQSQVEITCTLLKGYNDEDIAEGLSEQVIVQCKRIVKQPKSENTIPTTTLILTFNSSQPPDRVFIRTGLSERVRQIYSNAKEIFKCQHYGHSGGNCRRNALSMLDVEMRGIHNPETCHLLYQLCTLWWTS